jgi:hypothetical protein
VATDSPNKMEVAIKWKKNRVFKIQHSIFQLIKKQFHLKKSGCSKAKNR